MENVHLLKPKLLGYLFFFAQSIWGIFYACLELYDADAKVESHIFLFPCNTYFLNTISVESRPVLVLCSLSLLGFETQVLKNPQISWKKCEWEQTLTSGL